MKKLLTILAAATLAACSADRSVEQPTGNRNGILTVRIKSEKAATRAIVDGTAITDQSLKAFEDNVTAFTAYVFSWATGELEATATSSGGTASITGLSTVGAKRVVVIAGGANLANSSTALTNYASLQNGYIALDDQSFTSFGDMTKSFVMTGENAAAITLTEGNNAVEIPVRRVVSKIQLGDISFDDDVQLSSLAKFNLTGASIQRAAAFSGIGADDFSTYNGTQQWQGGIAATPNAALAGTPLNLEAFLIDLFNTKLALNLGAVNAGELAGKADQLTGTLSEASASQGGVSSTFSTKAFWYVLPNRDADNPTLLTLSGTYDGVPFYYPIEINTPESNPSAAHHYIKRNTIYKVNVHFHRFEGSADPNVPSVATSLTVTIEPQEWEGPIVQETTW